MKRSAWIWMLGLTVIGMVAAWSPVATGGELDPNLVERVLARLPGRVLRWGGDAEGGAPYQFRDPKDPEKIVGFEVDLVDVLVRRLGDRLSVPLRAEFVQYEWPSLPLGLDKRDFDLIAAGLEITPENRAKMRFSRPYYIYAQQLVVRADDNRVTSLSDCRGLTVGTLSGSAAERMLKDYGVESIRAYDGQTEPYRDLELKRNDAVLLDVPIAVYYAATNAKLKFTGPRIGRGAYGLAMRPEDGDLAAAIDEVLGELMASGEVRRIYQKWRLWNDDQAELAHKPIAAELAGLGFDASGKPLDGGAASEGQGGGSAEDAAVDATADSASGWTFDRYTPLLLRAAGMTVFLSVASMMVAMLLGLAVCVVRLYGPAPCRWLALGYVEFFRGTPLLLLLTFLYFGLPELARHLGLPESALDLGPIITAIVGFGLNYAAYEAEIYRSAIESVPVGQWEAARALGMSEPLLFRRIVLPQALRTALGPMTNDFVAMFKDTSLVSVIAVRELTKEYNILARSSQKFVELGLLTAALYLAMSVPLGYLSRYLEKRWGAGK